MDPRLFVCVAVFTLCVSECNSCAAVAQTVGLNYGLNGNNLPTPTQSIALLKSKNINKVRLFEPNPDVLKALQGSGIEAVVGTRNEDIPQLGSNPSFAASWVNTNVEPYAHSVTFRYVTVGNEIPRDLAVNLVPAIKNLESALKEANLAIPVSTSLSMQVLGASFPPSKGTFSGGSYPSVMESLTAYLEASKAPLLVNVYPYYDYTGDPKNTRLDYVLFTAQGVVVQDGGLGYSSLFDAMVDAVYSALEKAGGPSIELVVSESGWPSAGNGNIATISNAKTYNNNLIAHLKNCPGTPKRPGKAVETYLFSIFNENLKAPGIERNFGLYNPDMTEVYPVNFSP